MPPAEPRILGDLLDRGFAERARAGLLEFVAHQLDDA